VSGLRADAFTANPLLGRDSLEPLVNTARAHNAGAFVLVRTSNPGAADILDLELATGERLWERLAQLVAELGRHVRLLNHTHRSAAFVVLKAPDIPSALVETGCLSNAVEERNLRNGNYRQMVAGALVSSVNAYFDIISKEMADG